MASDDERRARAIKRLEAKRNFWRQVTLFALLSALFVIIWATTTPGGYFWPIWPMAGLAIALGFQAWATFGQRPITEADIEREMRREREPGS
jgi:hypothetical protein